MSQTKAQLIDNLVQPITGALGSASAPTFSFTADPNTGLFSPGADQLSLSTGGTGRLFVDASGRVGVGTASPGDKLTVYDTNGSITFGNSSVTEHKLNWDAGSVVLQADPANLNASSSIQFKVDATERARIDSSGRLGVGVSAPSAVLHVASTGAGIQEVQWLRNGQSVAADIGSALVFTGTTNDNGLARISGAFAGAATTDGAYMAFSTRAVTTGTLTERMRITAGGSVGIGTSSPAELVHLLSGSGSDCFLRLNSTSSANNSGIRWQSGGVARGIIASDGAFGGSTADFGILAEAGLSFYTNGTTTKRMVLDTSGRVGIGTTSPLNPLHIAAAIPIIRLQDTDGGRVMISCPDGHLDFEADSDNVTANSRVSFKIDDTERARIDSSGRLLVGTSTARENFFNSFNGAQLQLEGTNGPTSRLSIVRNSADNGEPTVVLAKSRGSSAGSNTAAQSGDFVGLISFQGSDGSEFVEAAQILAAVDGTPGANDMPGRLVFSTTADGASSPTERARITNNGLFKITSDGSYTGIDTNAHGARQTVTGNWSWMTVHSDASSPFGINIKYTGATPNSTSNFFMRCEDLGNTRLDIRSNGGIANFSANNANLSDRNAKKDISPAAGTWDCIKEWEIVNYRYKDQPDDADLNLGVIAQQVAESCPEVITVFEEAKDDQPEKLGIKEQQMYWMAIKALQEAQVRIEALEAEVAVLKAQ